MNLAIHNFVCVLKDARAEKPTQDLLARAADLILELNSHIELMSDVLNKAAYTLRSSRALRREYAGPSPMHQKVEAPAENQDLSRLCKVAGCTYSRAINQEYPRKCVYCGLSEVREEAPSPFELDEWEHSHSIRGKGCE
jgi:hypothetical protein